MFPNIVQGAEDEGASCNAVVGKFVFKGMIKGQTNHVSAPVTAPSAA
jgi:hypothetical protein